ncbi:MAG: hypothetical protein GX660_22280, partial [Clostridiaceae bacterium]|nr:hypothetical protein [Clostridiaceae bacterium]
MTIPKVNLGLIFFLFVLFAGMNFAAPDYTISECGRFANPGLYELTGDINTGYINTTFEDPTDHAMCAGDYLTWQTCILDPDFDPDVYNCTVEAAAYEACIDLNGYQDPQTACLQFRAIGGLGSQSIVLDCKGHKITTDVDYGILVYEPFAVLR